MFDLFNQRQKWLGRKKQPRAIVESFHLNTVVESYHQNICIYFRNKKQVTQLILSLVCKTIYGEYKSQHILVQCSKRTHLNDRLQNALKELKMGINNEKGCKKMVLQSDQVLAQLKAMDGHAI